MKMEDYLKNIEDNNVSYWLYVKENLKPNDYVKLNTGEITRSMNVSPIKGNKIYYANGDDCWFDISAVRDFSSNLIDLVEYMDLLYIQDKVKLYGETHEVKFFNPVRVDGFTKFEDGTHCIILNLDYFVDIKDLKIKGIITHEQLDNIVYKVGD